VLVSRDQVLRYEEMAELVGLVHGVAPLGKIRLTGGEPLLRTDLPVLVRALRKTLPDIELCLTTNGTLLGRHARELRRAGLDRINVSLDSADAMQLAAWTGSGSVDTILNGIRAAQAEGFVGTKLNAVLLRSRDRQDLSELVSLAQSLACELRFIELMPLGVAAPAFTREFLAAEEALAMLCRAFTYEGRLAERERPTITPSRYMVIRPGLGLSPR